MGERKRITLLYNFSEDWIGGTYYILNIIRALNYLEDSKKPLLIILHGVNSSLTEVKEIDYPYLEYRPFLFKLGYLQRFINKIFYYLNGETPFKMKIPSEFATNIYPLIPQISEKSIEKGYFWIPDFQEKHMPHLFSNYEIRFRMKSHKSYLKNKVNLVFSSQTAKNDFDNYYPENTNKYVVLRFVSIVDKSFENIDVTGLFEKYHIKMSYFIVPNQFWKHKNHEVILNAVKILSDKGVKFQMVLTGKEKDHRNPEYAIQLRDFVKENGLTDKILFLGFIPRDEQMQLMNNSLAIIQPSLFEGWSTVVEDSKVLNHFIIVSDIPIHKEQINENCIFFDPNNALELSDKMNNLLNRGVETYKIDYDKFIINFANKFVDLF